MAKLGCRLMTGLTDARSWANELIRRESRGAGDTENAMRRLESRYGIPWRTFWALRYRPPADVFVGVYLQLRAAYEAECERQQRLFEHEREITRRKIDAFAAVDGAAADPSRHSSRRA
jgi:hypothetical protein